MDYTWIKEAGDKFNTIYSLVDYIWYSQLKKKKMQINPDSDPDGIDQFNRFIFNGELNEAGKELYTYTENKRKEHLDSQFKKLNRG